MSGLEINQNIDIEQRMAWEMSPLMLVEGAEVLQNLRRSRVDEYEREQQFDLDGDYKKMRGKLLVDRFVVVGAMGRNKAGKGSMLMGFSRAFKQDLNLKERAKELDIDKIDVVIVPFVHCREAAKLPNAPQRYRVPANLRHTDYTFDISRKISQFQWSLIEEHVLPHGAKNLIEVSDAIRKEKRAIVLIVEASTPLVYPKVESGSYDGRNLPNVPVEVEGIQDLGNSTIFNLALDPRTRDNSFLYFVDKGDDLNDDKESNDFRARATSKDTSLNNVFEGSIKSVISSSSGKQKEVTKLTKEEQTKLATVLGRSMASPELVAQLDEILTNFEKSLVEKGLLHSGDDKGFFDYLSGKLWLPNGFIRVSNPQFDGEKTYDLDYLIKNLVTEKYPGIILTP